MSNFKFRPYQEDVINACIKYLQSDNKKGVVVVAPTSHGKSWDIAGIAKYHKGPILILNPSIELLSQNFEKFRVLDGAASIYSASFNTKEIGHVTYATLGSVIKEIATFKQMKNLLVIVDECHFKASEASGSQFRTFIDTVKPAKLIGLTATPFKLFNDRSGSTLKMITRIRPKVFSSIIYVQQISEMIDLGYWAPSADERWHYDRTGLLLNTTGSDYTDDSIKAANEANSVNRSIAIRLLELLPVRKSILVFTDCLENSKIFSTYFNKYTTTATIAGDTPKKERAEAIAAFKEGRIQILFNYGTLTVGFDAPEIDCIVLGRPTNSLAVLYQIYGRGVRIAQGKRNFLFLDACDNFAALCHPRDIVIEQDSVLGWAVFAGDRVITGVPLGVPIYKQDLIKVNNPGEDLGEMPFGKYKGRKIEDICKFDFAYIQYMVTVVSTEQYGPKLKNSMEEGLRRATLQKLTKD